MSEAQAALVYEQTIAIRWRDLDAYDHVNNSVFLTLLEEARIQWFNTFRGPWRSAEGEPVLARSEINYRLPIRYPASVRVQMLLGRVGRSSVSLLHVLSDAADGAVYADGSTVLVWVSPDSGRSVALPAAVLDSLPAYPAA